VRDEFEDILRFWLDHGAAGFRVDVAHALAKDKNYPDVGDKDSESALLASWPVSNHPFWDRPELHEIVRGWRRVLDSYDDVMMVAEAWVVSHDRLAMYLRGDEYHQAFEFALLQSPWDAATMHETIDASIAGAAAMHSVPTWVLSNHDVIRHATRYGLPTDVDAIEWLVDGDRSLLDHELGLRRARAATLALLGLPGSVYLYQGEELGLPEVVDLPTDVLQDPVWERSGHTQKGRDGCRVPIPWTVDGPSAGFGSNGSWLPQPDGWGEMSVEAQDGVDGSTLEFYRDALAVRREHMVSDTELTWVDLGADVLAYQRSSGVTCIVNMGSEPVELPEGEILVASGAIDGQRLAPDQAVWIR
jgi:alpha-glucosidase